MKVSWSSDWRQFTLIRVTVQNFATYNLDVQSACRRGRCGPSDEGATSKGDLLLGTTVVMFWISQVRLAQGISCRLLSIFNRSLIGCGRYSHTCRSCEIQSA